MFLKKIEIQGFKSFADRISIALEKGVTSIVGPNGSGKSNISDAVRWVLGEQSVKSLRGAKMDDVIFSGTEFRKPSGFAEVTLLIDNDGGGLPVPYSEVSVTRRIYRSGESEYLLNRNLCRLKDVNELFFDTGIGREGYSIIGQGKVDEILNNKPEDRRGIFEEAAGISKYKARRREAERKLESTSQNLVRIRDIIGELDIQMGILGEQAAVARKYLLLRDELREIEVAGYVSSIGKYEAALEKCEKNLASAKAEFDEQSSALASAEVSAERIRERISHIDGLQEELNKALLDVGARLSQTANQISLNEEKTGRAKADIERVRAEIARAGERKTGRGAELAASRKKHDYLAGELARYGQLLAGIKNEYDAVLSALGESDRAIEAMKQEAEDARNKYYDDKNKLSGMHAEYGNFKKNAAAIEKNLAAAIRETDADNIAKEEIGDQQHALSAEIEALHAVLRDLSQKRAALGAEFDEKKREIESAAHDLNTARARMKILADMEERFEGFYLSVRRVLAECKKNPEFGAGIRGAVAELIKAPKELETAISMALGAAQQNIVTDGEGAAERAIEFLKRTNGGRATFLPISSIKGRTLEGAVREKLAAQKGYIGIASDLIDYDDIYKNIVGELLGVTVVADKLENGLAIASRFGRKFRIVTLDGDIVAVGGAITGGSLEARDTGILGRQREIGELAASIKGLEAEKLIKDRDGALLGEALEILSGEIAAKEKEYNERRIENAALAQKASHLDEKLKTGSGRRELYKLELEESELGAAELGKAIKELEKSIESQNDAIEKKQSAIDEYADKNREGQQSRDALLADISAYNVSVASVTEAQKAVEESIERLENELADSDRSIASREAAILRYGRDIDKYSAETEAMQALTEGIEQERRGARLRLESAAAEKLSLLAEADETSGEAARVNSLLAGAGREINRYEIRAAKLKTELEHCKNRLWEDYELTYHNALNMLPGGADEDGDAGDEPEAVVLPGDDSPDGGAERYQTPNPPLMGEAAAKRSAIIRDEISALGPVNVLSIDEYAQTKSRREKMEAQSLDLLEASEKLKHIIAEMSRIMRKNFAEQFERININFDIVFRELFSGGKARLILSEGQDILEAGIEIEVQLPGKRMQNMMLYSGGERALTAIALIFAMLMLKKPPFCLLDEIESALDEANVERFSRYIKKYSEDIQFIMVTHRKGTMEGSNVLYGVTMQERGVSGIVSLRLSDAS